MTCGPELASLSTMTGSRVLRAAFAGAMLFALGGQSHAQAPAAPTDAQKTLLGSWEFSNADRDKRCTVTFKPDAAVVGMKVEFDRGCTAQFAFVKDIAGWTVEHDFLRLMDAKGKSVIEFNEVENGIYEAPRPGEGILFIQSAAAAGPAPRTVDEMAGEWTVMRGGKAICSLTLGKTGAGEDVFALRVHPGCDGFVTRFGPVSWAMDRSEMVLNSARGQSWRFEEGEQGRWQRVPETANPVTMVKK